MSDEVPLWAQVRYLEWATGEPEEAHLFNSVMKLERELAAAKDREAELTKALAEVQADLERALVAIQKHKDRYIFANPDFEDYELWKVLDRAALAPEQKGE